MHLIHFHRTAKRVEELKGKEGGRFVQGKTDKGRGKKEKDGDWRKGKEGEEEMEKHKQKQQKRTSKNATQLQDNRTQLSGEKKNKQNSFMFALFFV